MKAIVAASLCLRVEELAAKDLNKDMLLLLAWFICSRALASASSFCYNR
jgi:hypothetical protein